MAPFFRYFRCNYDIVCSLENFLANLSNLIALKWNKMHQIFGKHWFFYIETSYSFICSFITILILKIKNALMYQKRIRGVIQWKLMSDTTWICKSITNRWHNSFKRFENIRIDPEVKTLGATWVEAARCRTAFSHVWTAASTA